LIEKDKKIKELTKIVAKFKNGKNDTAEVMVFDDKD